MTSSPETLEYTPVAIGEYSSLPEAITDLAFNGFRPTGLFVVCNQRGNVLTYDTANEPNPVYRKRIVLPDANFAPPFTTDEVEYAAFHRLGIIGRAVPIGEHIAAVARGATPESRAYIPYAIFPSSDYRPVIIPDMKFFWRTPKQALDTLVKDDIICGKSGTQRRQIARFAITAFTQSGLIQQ